ncbi:unnamed protein product [Caenorhabditis angaria]|uniref:Uncharacterized protein n=1 Tax=Caenorhabditis angaria TaxID=860376 RepID=A0A9P1IWR5_9PELO|nr:unnamed protein product [Caenorhabditis angaria]
MEIKELFRDLIIVSTLLLGGFLMFYMEYELSKVAIYVPTTGCAPGSGVKIEPITIAPFTKMMITGLICYGVYRNFFEVDVFNHDVEQD